MSDSTNQAPVRLSALMDWATRLFVKQGMFAAQAEIAVLRLMESELAGRMTGGVRWLPRLISAMDVGDIDPRARTVIVADLPALTVIDGSTGLGQVALHEALQIAVKKAQAVGSATVVIKNSRPVGDPTMCLAAATSAGCLAGVMTSCKKQTDPWPIGPCTVWGWPGSNGPLVTSSDWPAREYDLAADLMAVGLGGKKASAVKKKLFADDAEFVCFVINLEKCTAPAQFQQVMQQASAGSLFSPPAWIFDSAQWPETAPMSEPTLGELRELALSARMPAEWV